MTANGPPFPLSKFVDGINCFESEASDNQAVEALDVWESLHNCVRRPAFIPIATGPVYVLPAGACYVKIESSAHVFTTYTDRNPTFASNAIGGILGGGSPIGRLWVGCREPFDGIDFRSITGLPVTLTAHRVVNVKYRNTSNVLSLAYGVIDTTVRRGSLSTKAQSYCQPFMQNGRMSWHRSQFTSWTATTLDGVSAYWVALDISSDHPQFSETEPITSSCTGTGNFVISAPGIRAFVANPINGLFATKLRNQAPVVFAGADVRLRRGHELGGNLGFVRNVQSETEIARLLLYEGSGVLDQITRPAWSAGGSGTSTLGTTNVLTKFQSTEWFTNELDGTSIVTAIAPSGGSTTTRILFTLSTYLGNVNFEGFRLRCSVDGASAIPVGEEREVVYSDLTGFTVYPAFSDTPAADDRFELRTPPAFLRTREGERNYEIDTNTATTATLLTTPSVYTAARATADTQAFVNFEAMREAPWAIEPGLHWSFIYDPSHGKVFCTNGHTGILEYDGTRLRRLQALWDGTDGVEGSSAVQLWTGNIQDQAQELENPDINNQAALRHTPPNARHLAYFRGHIVCTLREEPTTIQWSAPNAFNVIWPALYSTRIRDSENNPITGIFTLNELLIASTVTGLHAAPPPIDKGLLIFQPFAQGFGFVNQASVARIVINGQSALIGPNADGFTLCTGAGPQSVLDSWFRLLPEGVNLGGLVNAVGAAWTQLGCYFCAFPSAGSAVNNRVAVFDYVSKKWWLWSAPYGGISYIARDFDDTGEERLLFGHNDGTISILGESLTDAGAFFYGYAKSPPLAFGQRTMACTQLQVSCEEQGVPFNNFVVRSYLNRGPSKQSLDKTLAMDGAEFGSSLFNGAATVFGTRTKTFALKLLNGSYGDVFQYAIFCGSPFIFRGATLLATAKGMRTK